MTTINKLKGEAMKKLFFIVICVLIITGCGKNPTIDTEVKQFSYVWDKAIGSDYRIIEIPEIGRNAYDIKSSVPLSFANEIPKRDLKLPLEPRIVVVLNDFQKVVFIDCSKSYVELNFNYLQNK